MYRPQVRELRQALETMRKAKAVFKEYCTEECGDCPLYQANMCGYDLELDTNANITDGMLETFVDYGEKVEEAKDRKLYKEVTGLDPGF